jgi:hypothetical protein
MQVLGGTALKAGRDFLGKELEQEFRHRIDRLNGAGQLASAADRVHCTARRMA